VRIVNDINWWHQYRQTHKTRLAIPEMKASDVKNLDNISENISRYYGKKKSDWLFWAGNSQWHQSETLMLAFTTNLISWSWYGRLMTLIKIH